MRLSDKQHDLIALTAEANERSITEEVLRRVEVTLQYEDWEDRLHYSKAKVTQNKLALINALTEAMKTTIAELAATEASDTVEIPAETIPSPMGGRVPSKRKKAAERRERKRAAEQRERELITT